MKREAFFWAAFRENGPLNGGSIKSLRPSRANTAFA